MDINGIVQKGRDRGKKLGFPTINFQLLEIIPDGIYISRIVIRNKTYNALTFIGAAKTFGEIEQKAETYVLDFDEDVYGEEVEVSLLKKIRENQRFGSEKDLIEQMKKDKKEAEEYFNPAPFQRSIKTNNSFNKGAG